MKFVKNLLAIAFLLSVVLSLEATPVTLFLQAKPVEENKESHPPAERITEIINITPKPRGRFVRQTEEKVETLERFHRVYEDETIEWKIVLSNGFAQYQKITNKAVCGKIIQVQEGYHSERLPDKTYRTTYYIADENGYRRLRREFDTKPPVLPVYVPYVPKLPKVTEPLRC